MAEEKQFEQYVEKVMNEVVSTHQHNHPLYEETIIHERVIDIDNKRAAFVLFEQIDTEGLLRNQFSYSVWFVKEREQPREIYEDHSYLRRSGPFGDLRGREPSIKLEEVLADGVIARITPRDGRTAFGSLSQIKVKITLDGKIQEPEDFIEQAKNLVMTIGPKLGFDYMRVAKRLEGENVAAMIWATENGSTYGYETVYLVWKDKSGQLRYRILRDSKRSRESLEASINTEENNILVNVEEDKSTYRFRVSKKELDLK